MFVVLVLTYGAPCVCKGVRRYLALEGIELGSSSSVPV
jgi:hypothetical protein